jgi:hypothetical protein
MHQAFSPVGCEPSIDLRVFWTVLRIKLVQELSGSLDGFSEQDGCADVGERLLVVAFPEVAGS